jgi:hypothetical protein
MIDRDLRTAICGFESSVQSNYTAAYYGHLCILEHYNLFI